MQNHWNSTISTNNSKHCTIDVKDLFLNSHVEEHECMRMQLSILPEEIIALHNLREIADADGFVCIEIQGGIYGLRQAESSSFNDLVKHLVPYGHAPVQCTPGVWTNKKNVMFTLFVDDFGRKHNSLHNL